MAAYPEARVILQTCGLDSWYTYLLRDSVGKYLGFLGNSLAQWWPVSHKLRLLSLGGNYERDDIVAVHQKSMDRMRELKAHLRCGVRSVV